MKGTSSRVLLFLAMLSLAHYLFGSPSVVRPGEPWLDDRGQQIQAHGGGILNWRGNYYWFGEDRTPSNDPDRRYVACYSSKDLVHWKFRHQVLALADPDHLGPNWILERPKVFRNPRTGKFVLYAHLGDASSKVASVAVAVSDQIDGDYHYLKSFRPLDEESRDIGQFVDDDGTAYLIFESRPTKGFFIAKLSDDYLSVEKKVSFVDTAIEGGALVRWLRVEATPPPRLHRMANPITRFAVSRTLLSRWVSPYWLESEPKRIRNSIVNCRSMDGIQRCRTAADEYLWRSIQYAAES